MNAFKFVDDSGSPVFMFSSTVPGVSICPPGFRPDEAVKMTSMEFDSERKKRETPPQPDRVQQLTDRILVLENTIKELKKNRLI